MLLLTNRILPQYDATPLPYIVGKGVAFYLRL